MTSAAIAVEVAVLPRNGPIDQAAPEFFGEIRIELVSFRIASGVLRDFFHTPADMGGFAGLLLDCRSPVNIAGSFSKQLHQLPVKAVDFRTDVAHRLTIDRQCMGHDSAPFISGVVNYQRLM